MNARDIEIAIAEHIGYRRYIVVPNVSWGLGLHECDILALSESGYATEVEIKITLADLRRDKLKPHQHLSGGKVKYLWFAVPQNIADDALTLIPERAGLMKVTDDFRVLVLRRAFANLSAKPLNNDDRLHLAHLGCMRIWKLKRLVRDMANPAHLKAQ